MSKIIHTSLSATVVDNEDGSFTVRTPINNENGFKSAEDAIEFCNSYGIVDKRKFYQPTNQ